MFISGIAPMQLLVLQPTTFCNLDCSYCYLPDRSNRKRMRVETLREVGRKVIASPAFSDDSTIVWHAGEPLVLPADWYRDACRTLEAEGGKKIARQSFQTNATLINDGWVDYFSQPGVSVGVSLDGPEQVNDLFRRNRAGQGTWSASMRGIGRLHAGSVPFHIICVVTAAALDKPEEIARALIDAGPTSIGLNMEEIEGVNHTSSLLSDALSAKIRRFIDRFHDVLEGQADGPRFREYDNLSGLLSAARKGRGIRNQENSPGAILSVDTAGNVSTYSPELMGSRAPEFNNFKFGNLHDMRDFSDIFLNTAFLRCHKQVAAGVARCKKTCAHFPICGGGTPANKFGETGRLDSAETAFCRASVKTVLDQLVDRKIAETRVSRSKAHG